MAFYFSSVTKALYDTDVFPVASLPANKVEITEAVYTELMTKQNQGYVIMADSSGNPYTVNQSEASATDIKHAASVATTLALGHVKIGNTMTAANDGTLDVKDDAITAAKVKDNETLPVNVSGNAGSSYTLIGKNMVSGTNGYSLLATLELSNVNAVYAGAMFAVVSRGGGACFEGIVSVSLSEYTNAGNETAPIVGNVVVMNCRGANLEALTSKFDIYMLRIEAGKYQLYVHKKESGLPVSCTILAATECTCTLYSSGAIANLPSAIETKKLDWICNKGVGSPATPVYVDSSGQVQPCDASPFIINKMVKEDGTDLDFLTLISFDVGYDEGFKTIGKLNISPSNKNCIIDITFISRRFEEVDENDNSDQIPAATFAVFVGDTEISSFYLQGSISNLDNNYTPYSSSPSFRCTFSANINNTIYIKVKKSGYYSRKLKIHDIKIQGLAFYKD